MDIPLSVGDSTLTVIISPLGWVLSHQPILLRTRLIMKGLSILVKLAISLGLIIITSASSRRALVQHHTATFAHIPKNIAICLAVSFAVERSL